MEVKIYQTFFDMAQLPMLDHAFIPYDNLDNKQPQLREYPLLKKMVENNCDYTGRLGMVSWRWRDKCKVSGAEYIEWIKKNPGYDVYHISPFTPTNFNNIFTQGFHHHKGMDLCFQRICELMDINFDFERQYDRKYFITCHYYVTSVSVLNKLVQFMERIYDLSLSDAALYKFMHEQSSKHYDFKNSTAQVINFSFVMERIPSLFFLLNQEYSIYEYLNNKPRHIPSVLRR